MEIKSITAGDYTQLANIYLEGIATGNATFQTEAPAWEDWHNSHLPHGRIALFENDTMLGWAALTPVSSRCVYAGVAEVSVYVRHHQRKKGIGKLLLQRLVEESEKAGLWTLQAGIFPENTASIKLHQSCGFRVLGVREKIGCMNGVWRDNLVLERRSKVVGI